MESHPAESGSGTPTRDGGPTLLDLVRLGPDTVLPPGGEDLYRKIALLTEMQEGMEVLDVACGRGLSTSFWVSQYGVEGAGVDPDAELIRHAEQLARGSGVDDRLHFQSARLDDLPYKDEIFDVAVGELGLATTVDPARAIHEMVRVTRPMGSIVLVQLIWTGNVDPLRREVLVQHLGARPMLLVEWKQLLRDAGVVELLVEDWSDEPSPFRPEPAVPFPDLTSMFSFREKMKILQRAMKRWGWRGVRGAILREQEIHSLLTRERVLGLTLIKGTKWKRGPEANA